MEPPQQPENNQASVHQQQVVQEPQMGNEITTRAKVAPFLQDISEYFQ